MGATARLHLRVHEPGCDCARHAPLRRLCPECGEGKVYRQKEPATLVRIVGQPPLEATVYEMERLRCNACGEVFTADEPAEAGPEKYDVTAAAMIALLKYGSGVPFNRLERLEGQLGMPLPAATQWELVEAAAAVAPAGAGRVDPAGGAGRGDAQRRHRHADSADWRANRATSARAHSPAASYRSGRRWKIALFFSGRKHAGENLAEVLKQRARELPPPIQMCDALSRNMPKLEGIDPVANCLAHGRRQFVEVAENFPEECRYVLETLGVVYHNDALAREQELSPEERLRFHQEHSGPMMQALHDWMEAQLEEQKTEPNSGLGKAIAYMLKHWEKLTLFLRQAGAPLDNNVVERALKKAILHRKNALFYKTLNGAEVGDLFMSLIHTCQLNGANPFDYLTELQRHAGGAVSASSRSGCRGTTARRWRRGRRSPHSMMNPVMAEKDSTSAIRNGSLKMPAKRTSGKPKSDRVFGQRRKETKMFRVGLYARVSTLDQQTLPMQNRAMREYAARRGWTIVMQVREIGSGAAQREAREKLLEAARRREIDVVLVWRLDRWGRSLADLVVTLKELAAPGRRLRIAHRSSRSDHTDRSRHGWAAGGVRRVRTRRAP